MTGAELKQLRKDLGEAIGRPLSVNDFAKLCGLPPESGGGTYPIDEEIISESDAAFYRAMMRAGIMRRLG
jgi:hypothetical protein